MENAWLWGAWSSEPLTPKAWRTNRLREGSCTPRMIGTPMLGLLLPCQACQLQPHLAGRGEGRFARRTLRLSPRTSQTGTRAPARTHPATPHPVGTRGSLPPPCWPYFRGCLEAGGRLSKRPAQGRAAGPDPQRLCPAAARQMAALGHPSQLDSGLGLSPSLVMTLCYDNDDAIMMTHNKPQ